MTSDYERGFEECRRQCLAYAQERTVSKSVLRPALGAIDDAFGSEMASEHEWFSKGRVSSAKKIAEDIAAMKCPDQDGGDEPDLGGEFPGDAFQCGQQ